MTTSEQLTFKPWIKRYPGRSAGGLGVPPARRAGGERSDPGISSGAATVVFPHAGGGAAAYRTLATSLSAKGFEAFVMQYPQRADRLAHPAPETVEGLATELFEAGAWDRVGPLRLFGHCMGAVVAFEFARVAERHGVDVQQLWVSASQAPSTVASSAKLPITDKALLADMVDLGGTDPRLLADEDFVELLIPALRADYQAFNRYACGTGVRIRADIHAIGGNRDHRIDRDMLGRWDVHTDGVFTLLMFDGGHFYINEHTDAVAELVNA